MKIITCAADRSAEIKELRRRDDVFFTTDGATNGVQQDALVTERPLDVGNERAANRRVLGAALGKGRLARGRAAVRLETAQLDCRA